MTIRHRESLVYMLCEAAELEHALMCGYLYAANSLKETRDEGLTESQVTLVQGWRRAITRVAVEEMQHLALVNNILVALGEAPHFSRPNLPVPGRHFPETIRLGMLPFGEAALRHFLYLERPEGCEQEDAPTEQQLGYALPAMDEGDIVPFGQTFDTVGHLYREIAQGLSELVDAFGEDWVFLGEPSQQQAGHAFQWPELLPVTDLAGAHAAIQVIIEQGEGASGDWRNGHFGRFLSVYEEFRVAKAADPDFEPVRPVVPVRTRVPLDLDPDRHAAVLTDDPLTARFVDAFNVANETLLQVLSRVYGHSTETTGELEMLAETAIGLMHGVLSPLGRLLGRLPAGSAAPGATAGATFDLFYTDGYLLPQPRAFWTILHERLVQLGEFVAGAAPADERLAAEAGRIEATLRRLAARLTAGRPELATRFAVAAP